MIKIPKELNINSYSRATKTITLDVVDNEGKPLYIGNLRFKVFKRGTQIAFINIEMVHDGNKYSCILTQAMTDVQAAHYNYHIWHTENKYPVTRGIFAVSDVHTDNSITPSKMQIIN